MNPTDNPYIEKLPLFYWLALPFVLLFRSTAEWVIRLPSALSAFAITWLLFFRVRRYFDGLSALFSAFLPVYSRTDRIVLTLGSGTEAFAFWLFLVKSELNYLPL
jgi:4-amino-4-deoxy-L-arabinose transferase-like glycosyltransferase